MRRQAFTSIIAAVTIVGTFLFCASDASAAWRRVPAAACAPHNSYAELGAGLYCGSNDSNHYGFYYCPFTDDSTLDHTSATALWVDFYVAQVGTWNYGTAAACAQAYFNGYDYACDSIIQIGGSTVGWYNYNLPHTSWTNNPGWYASVAVEANYNVWYMGMFVD